MPKAADIARQWYVIDAAGKPLGRVAAQAATLLRGKHKPTFAPHADCGDCVIILNAADVVLTGKKLEQKTYYHHTGYIGNLKEVKYSKILKERPEFAVELAVKRMLPATTLGRLGMTRLRVYRGSEHEQSAQNPTPWTEWGKNNL
jgi:large subunit ribosomal protein L13